MEKEKTGKGSNHAKGKAFWDKEYKRSGNKSRNKNEPHLALSEDPSEDLISFTHFLEREFGRKFLNPVASVVDLGCGNGRNLLYLCRNFGMRGVGFDISKEAILQARKASRDEHPENAPLLEAGEHMPLSYEVRSIAQPLPLPDASQTIALDMMTSHFLNDAERQSLLTEIVRVLRPGGWLFLKTFLRDEDSHAERLLAEHPGEEAGSYIHPKIGIAEHVFTEEELVAALEKDFYIHKISKSHRHRERGHAAKRRSISIYAEKNS